MREQFEGKSIIVTGASAGIGEALAMRLASHGGKLTLAARRRGRLEAVAERCREAGGKAVVAPADITEPEACRSVVDTAVDAFGGIDMLVNNAGMTMWARFDEITDLTLFERLMAVNYLGSVYCTHYALPHLKESQGLLVAVSSLTGKTGVPFRTGYAATKHAMQGLFDSLRIELRDHGVDVLVISPGFVNTGVRDAALGPDGTPLGESPRDEDRATMSLETCIDQMVKAMARRERELVMTAKARVGLWLKLVAPGLVDKIAENALKTKEQT